MPWLLICGRAHASTIAKDDQHQAGVCEVVLLGVFVSLTFRAVNQAFFLSGGRLLDVARMSSKDGEDSSHDRAHETFTICNKIELNYYFEVLLY
jgi:hypothetical protein